MNSAASPIVETEPNTSHWHIGRPTGNEGPLSFNQLQQHARAGTLTRSDLLWKPSLPQWVPADSIAGLFMSQPPVSGPMPATGPGARFDVPPIAQLAARMGSAKFFRTVGRACGAFAALLLVASLALFAFWRSWWTEAILFFILFMVGEGVAAVLDAVDKLSRKSD